VFGCMSQKLALLGESGPLSSQFEPGLKSWT